MADERVIGPSLPPGFRRDDTGESDDEQEETGGGARASDDDVDAYGPALPPVSSNAVSTSRAGGSGGGGFIGPVMPVGGSRVDATFLEDGSESSDGGDAIGPSLAEMRGEGDQYPSAADEFEARYRRTKEASEQQAQPASLSRESWMTDVPSDRLGQQIGLESRKFRAQPASQVDKSWGETPADREKLHDHSKDRHSQKHEAQHERASKDEDRAISETVSKHNKKRGKSLMEMHAKKLKKEKKKEKERNEKAKRQPFDREKDLQVNRFDDAQRKSVLKKAALLDTRFAHGARKYE